MTVRRIVIDRVEILVADLGVSRGFCEAALPPLRFGIVEQSETSCGFGVEASQDFAIGLIAEGDTPTTAAHVLVVAQDRVAVEAFCVAALAASGRGKQGPALHPEYSTGYYGAFVYDPDGNNVEAVFHDRA